MAEPLIRHYFAGANVSSKLSSIFEFNHPGRESTSLHNRTFKQSAFDLHRHSGLHISVCKAYLASCGNLSSTPRLNKWAWDSRMSGPRRERRKKHTSSRCPALLPALLIWRVSSYWQCSWRSELHYRCSHGVIITIGTGFKLCGDLALTLNAGHFNLVDFPETQILALACTSGIYVLSIWCTCQA